MREKIEWAVIVKIKIRTKVEVKNTIKLVHQENEMIGFELPVVSLINTNIDYEVINQFEDEDDEDDKEHDTINLTSNNLSE